MPGRKVHEIVDVLLLGQKCSQVHKMIDLPSIWLGKGHRVLFHDEPTALLIGYVVGGPKGALSALLHIWLDRFSRQ
jgi:hypothetical protein